MTPDNQLQISQLVSDPCHRFAILHVDLESKTKSSTTDRSGHACILPSFLSSNHFFDQIEIQQNYSRLQNDLQSLAGKIGELEQEAEEHGLRHSSSLTSTLNLPYSPSIRLVLTTLNEALQVEPDRKCFRLIGGILVERTVKDVVPALQTNREGVCTYAPLPRRYS